jgi:hypothetical protein
MFHSPAQIHCSRADRHVLEELSRTSVTRQQLRADGFIDLSAAADLHPYGYTVRHWLRLNPWQLLMEFIPRHSDLPRVTADCYERQARLHRALGLNLVAPGECWNDYQNPGLFDDYLLEEYARAD